MNTHILLYQLRERLRLVNERTMERATLAHETCNNIAAGNNLLCVLATGALLELRSEPAMLLLLPQLRSMLVRCRRTALPLLLRVCCCAS